MEDSAAAADADDDRGAADEQGRLLCGRQRDVAQARRAGRAQGQALHARHPTHSTAGKYKISHNQGILYYSTMFYICAILIQFHIHRQKYQEVVFHL